jgi:hypothetical protein
MEPGARWNMDPWLLAPPRKLWRRITPWNPFPLEVPMTSTRSAPWKMSTRTGSPAFTVAPSARRNSRSIRVGGTPARS